MTEGMQHLSSKPLQKSDEMLKLVSLVRVSFLQVDPIIPRTPELQNWEEMD
jgi:hypothetical protein